jgi:hypothetical protein
VELWRAMRTVSAYSALTDVVEKGGVASTSIVNAGIWRLCSHPATATSIFVASREQNGRMTDQIVPGEYALLGMACGEKKRERTFEGFFSSYWSRAG